MFFKKNKQIEELEKSKKEVDELLYMGKPYLFWCELVAKLEMMDISDILGHCVMENIELKTENRKLKKENEVLSEALNKIIKGDENKDENK